MEECLHRDPQLRALRVVYGTVRHAKSCLSQFTERTPGSFIEERDASIVWRYFSGDEAVDSGDRAWARRQAAEAQNHIFDRFVALLFSLRVRLRMRTVLGSVTDSALFPGRMPSLSYQTTSRDQRLSARFCMLVAQLTPHERRGSSLRKVRALHMQKISCLLSVAMKSCYVG